jgi:hypothetical protein
VDGIERELGARARVVRLPARGALGRELAQRGGTRGAPATLVFDGAGALVYEHAGIPSRGEVVAHVAP